MKLPEGKGSLDTPARTASRAAGKTRYPMGKALARIRYFERQRGTPVTRAVAGHVVTDTSVRKSRKGGARSNAPYTAAAAKKIKLEPPKFSAAVNLPVWRELGPTHIPKGQSYGKSQPPVSGRCNGIFIDPADPRRTSA